MAALGKSVTPLILCTLAVVLVDKNNLQPLINPAFRSSAGYFYAPNFMSVCDVGAAVRLPKVKDTLAERILPELDVQRLIALLPAGRDHVMLRLCYAAGLRVSELVGIKRRDLQPRADGEGQVTVFGKGGKTRVILLPASVWREIQGVGGAAPDAPLFRSRKGGHLTTRQAQRIVEAAAQSAGIEAAVSPHWLRHAHVSHALDRGAPAHVVRDTVGHANLSTTSRYAHARPTESSAKYLAV